MSEEAGYTLCDNCQKEILKVNLALHSAHCERFFTYCWRCNEGVHKHEFDKHIASVHGLTANLPYTQPVPMKNDVKNDKVLGASEGSSAVERDLDSQSTFTKGSTITSERSTGLVTVGTDNWHHLEVDANNDVYLPCEFCMTAILMSDFEAHSRTCAQEQNTEDHRPPNTINQTGAFATHNYSRESSTTVCLPCEFCHVPILMKDLEDHELFCGSRTSTCDICQQRYLVRLKSVHTCHKEDEAPKLLHQHEGDDGSDYEADYWNRQIAEGSHYEEETQDGASRACVQCGEYLPMDCIDIHEVACRFSHATIAEPTDVRVHSPCSFCSQLIPNQLLEAHEATCSQDVAQDAQRKKIEMMERRMADSLERDRLIEIEIARTERLLRMRERESLRDLERSARDENARRLEAEYAANVSRLEAEYARRMERERWEREREQLNQNRWTDFGERLMPHVLNVAGQLIGSYLSPGTNQTPASGSRTGPNGRAGSSRGAGRTNPSIRGVKAIEASPNTRGTPPNRGGTPSNRSGTPSNSGGTPSGRGGTPSNRGGTPSGRGGTPSNRGGTPSNRGGTPSGRGGTPSSKGGTPSNRGGSFANKGGATPKGGNAPSNGGAPSRGSPAGRGQARK